MLQLVQKVREGKPANANGTEEVSAQQNAWEQVQMKDKKEQHAKKGWQIASMDVRGSPAGSHSDTQHFRRP